MKSQSASERKPIYLCDNGINGYSAQISHTFKSLEQSTVRYWLARIFILCFYEEKKEWEGNGRGAGPPPTNLGSR